MKKQNLILSAALAAVFSSSVAFAEFEVTGKIVHESAAFTTSGTSIGAANAHGKDVFKIATQAKIFVDGDASDSAAFHVELNAYTDLDFDNIGNDDSNESYTQRDFLREAYIDTEVNDWSIRAGKQQVVWGTADGMKLLDMINPSDYSEMAQNQMEDSRIPVWMINAETTQADGSELQVVISQPRENIFAGLNRNVDTSVRVNGTQKDTTADGVGQFVMDTSDLTTSAGHDQGQAFIMKGVDSITGKSNGFTNIVPDLGSIAMRFYNEFGATGLNTLQDSKTTVNWFATQSAPVIYGAFGASYPTIASFSKPVVDGGNGLDGAAILGGFAGAYDTNLIDAASASAYRTDSNSTFEYMQNTTFGTFDAMAGAGSQYVYNMPSDSDLDVAMKYKNATANGVNYTANYSYNYDKNPIINLSWRNSTGGELTTTRTRDVDTLTTTLKLTDAAGRYGAHGTTGTSAGLATLRFEETVKRAHNIGGSFDTAIESKKFGPVVIRGEALYQKDVYSPVMDLTALSIGDLPAALTMVKGDRFKYVLGADITVLTNMMISAQFIQDRNLDYIDTTSTINDHTLNKFTADYSTMSLTNNFNKAEENKEFYSLFFSKPFGASGEHRWNNILMLEENGGKWSRLDAEFSINDSTQATVEYNKYWGDENTQFGQLAASSNVQVGFKHSF